MFIFGFFLGSMRINITRRYFMMITYSALVVIMKKIHGSSLKWITALQLSQNKSNLSSNTGMISN